jgi:hypothetical protein
MFVRVVGRYQEVLESYRHPVTGKPTNRRVVRWPVGHSLEEEWRANALAGVKQAFHPGPGGERKNRYRLLKLDVRGCELIRALRGLAKMPPDEAADERERTLRLELARLSGRGNAGMAADEVAAEEEEASTTAVAG